MKIQRGRPAIGRGSNVRAESVGESVEFLGAEFVGAGLDTRSHERGDRFGSSGLERFGRALHDASGGTSPAGSR